ncbi:MAG: hypothetical protein HPY65_09255 [Syntrophaceae bacterium]|nr:hypothetical protein [Syntrophaceae bacterium]
MINPAKAYTAADYIEILRRRIWYIVIPFVLIVTGAVGYTIFAPRQYKASTLILVTPQRIPEAFVQATVTSKVEERLQSIAQEVLSRTRLEQIINDLNLYQKERKSLSREEIVALMQKDIKIELPTRKDESKGFFTISYIGRDPNIVTTVANRLASHFIEENLKLREQQAVGTTEFLTVELTEAKKKLDEMEAAVTQYKQRHMGALPQQMDANLKIMEQMQNQYQRLSESLRAAQDRKLYLQKQMSDLDSPVSMPGGRTPGSDQQYDSSSGAVDSRGSYESQKDMLTRQLEDLRTRYTESHPDVVATKKKLNDLERKKNLPLYDVKRQPRYRELANQLALTSAEIARAQESERNLMSEIRKYQGRVEMTPAREQDMASLLREHQMTKENYERLLKKSQEAQQAENLERRQKGEQFRIIDPARTPEKPFSPDIPRILLIGLVAGIVGGFGMAFLREQLDRSFHDSGDVEVTLGLKVLANIPKIEEGTT